MKETKVWLQRLNCKLNNNRLRSKIQVGHCVLRRLLFSYYVRMNGIVYVKCCCYVCVQEIDANLKELTFDTFTQLYHNMLFSPSVSSCLLTLLLSLRMQFDCFVCLTLVWCCFRCVWTANRRILQRIFLERKVSKHDPVFISTVQLSQVNAVAVLLKAH